jgi:hypothetical protein
VQSRSAPDELAEDQNEGMTMMISLRYSLRAFALSALALVGLSAASNGLSSPVKGNTGVARLRHLLGIVEALVCDVPGFGSRLHHLDERIQLAQILLPSRF